MFHAYKYRIYPTQEQEELINHTFNCCRLVYNLALQVKIDAYKNHGVNMSFFQLCHQMVEMKKDYEWLQRVDAHALQAAVKKVDLAFVNFYKGFARYPKFKKKYGRQSFHSFANGRFVYFDKKLLKIPKLYNIPIEISRKFEGQIKTVTISKTSTDKYFASILVDNKKDFPIKNKISEETSIGVDVGIRHFATLSDGSKINNPRHLKINLKQLSKLHKRVSRKKFGGKNRKKASKKMLLVHEKIANRRKDFLHKLSTAIVKQYDTICVEELGIENMKQNHVLAQAITDAGWATFKNYLKYKCEWYGKNLIGIGRFQASTKVCNVCESRNDTLILDDREWVCANCGNLHDRDVNAAINIKKIALKNSGWDTSSEPVELLSLERAKKQETISTSGSDSFHSTKNKLN